MKIEITQDESYQIVGALVLLSRIDSNFGLKELADKISKQSVEVMKKKYSKISKKEKE